MIILRLLGGLGNQLFIYAIGRALEIGYNIDVQYDIYSGFKNDQYKRKFELGKFNTKLKKTSIYDSLYFPIRKRSKLITKMLYPSSIYFKETENFSENHVINANVKYKMVFLQGYFQKLEYFENMRKHLIKEITPLEEISMVANIYLDAIIKNNSIAVHVRRKEINHTVSDNFYVENIEKLQNQIRDPKFYIFSDDINWCKENFKIYSNLTFIENTANEIEDFWLMKNCSHFIIPNSTFSWWAAWLGDYQSKVVIKLDNKY